MRSSKAHGEKHEPSCRLSGFCGEGGRVEEKEESEEREREQERGERRREGERKKNSLVVVDLLSFFFFLSARRKRETAGEMPSFFSTPLMREMIKSYSNKGNDK